ncbi:M48 family metallopeptidase [Shewanella sp. WXL01]|uniref:M48 metallopeptidase family protein n=1 Tax=Shewanella sp. WXL01 TaxID=2709721 RepID=UPI0014383C86|nr:YgjP-like metallopeptidase domain-containing protein [Shewanella sp. WXL01]NKF50397.1 M48 family metallopeptidase [Shewanella sp. WXL01]
MARKADAKLLKPKVDVLSLPNSKDLKPNSDPLRFIRHYPQAVISQAKTLLDNNELGEHLLKKYPRVHNIRTDKALYDYTLEIKQAFLKQTDPLSKVIFDDKISLSHQALGLHSYVNRRQGNKVKAKNEIRISSRLKRIPEPLLKMVIVHELAHLREKDHNKAFYQLCCNMQNNYHQLELDMRLLLICESIGQSPY